MKELEQIEHLMWVIEHNHPRHETTLAKCRHADCEIPARGGMCASCAEKLLSELTTEDKAKAFHDTVRATNQAYWELKECLK